MGDERRELFGNIVRPHEVGVADHQQRHTRRSELKLGQRGLEINLPLGVADINAHDVELFTVALYQWGQNIVDDKMAVAARG